MSFMILENSLAIKCYQCQSATDSRCSDEFKLPFTEAIVDCDKVVDKSKHKNNATTFCRKIKQKSKRQFAISDRQNFYGRQVELK